MSTIEVEGWGTADQLGALQVSNAGAPIQSSNPPGDWCDYYLRNGITQPYIKAFKAEAAEIYGHFHVECDVSFLSRDELWLIQHPDASLSWGLKTDASGRLQIVNASNTPVATGTTPLAADTWHCIQFRARLGDVTGNPATYGLVQVRLNGLTSYEVEALDIDTKNGSNTVMSRWRLTYTTSNNYCHYADVVIYDTSGTVNNSWTGCVGVKTLGVTAEGDLTQWDPNGAASSYQCVDDRPHDGDATYASTSVLDEIHLFALENLPSSYAPAGPIAIKARARKVEPGSRALAIAYKTSGANQVGVDQGLAMSYAHVGTILDVDETDSAPWDETKINSLQPGVKAR